MRAPRLNAKGKRLKAAYLALPPDGSNLLHPGHPDRLKADPTCWGNPTRQLTPEQREKINAAKRSLVKHLRKTCGFKESRAHNGGNITKKYGHL